MCIYMYIYTIHTHTYIHTYTAQGARPRQPPRRRPRPGTPGARQPSVSIRNCCLMRFNVFQCVSKHHLMYGLYCNVNNLRFNNSQNKTTACANCWFVSTEIVKCRLLKWLLDQPTKDSPLRAEQTTKDITSKRQTSIQLNQP